MPSHGHWTIITRRWESDWTVTQTGQKRDSAVTEVFIDKLMNENKSFQEQNNEI